MNIFTYVCIDVDELGNDVLYPNLGQHANADERRLIYWRCATTFCLSSMRFNKQADFKIKNPFVSYAYVADFSSRFKTFRL